MRDALSILDKIVSFTNGEVNYGNTLEHLNILDADYFFKLLACMQQQDLAGALLLFDDINRKGFEGDLVLEGIADFLRNLLVCKDEKVAGLLEAVESFKEKYISTAKTVSPSYIISALNVVNESTIHYKAARNKRLHVELCLIKLSYLQQALEITSGDDNIGKKKRIDSVIPLAFRRLPIVEVKESASIAAVVQPSATVKKQEAKLMVETAVGSNSAKSSITTNADTGKSSTTTGGKLSALTKIRQQFANGNATEQAVIVPLTTQALQDAWNNYTLDLRAAKNPAVQSFDLAELRIKDEGSFDIVTPNNLQLKFVEQERNKLSDYLQKIFNNRALTFSIIIEEKLDMSQKVAIPLSTKEQFQKIAEQYPLVKELKDKLRLELDY